ncbi:unnamed protein product, partial [Dibothriocephalus latus]
PDSPFPQALPYLDRCGQVKTHFVPPKPRKFVEAFRQQLTSTGGSEASVESMAAVPEAQSTRLSSNSSCSLTGHNTVVPGKFDQTTPRTLPPHLAGADRKLSTLCSTARVTVYRRWSAEASAARRPPLFGTIVPARTQSPSQFTDVFIVKWSEEPVQMQIDVKTGHLILSYMEERLRNRDRLDADWAAISSYESEEAVPCEAANKPENACKNRASCPVPYEQTRVMLSNRGNGYINASLVFDHDPRTPTYIAAETPLPGTVAAFWQMVWEQFAVVIVCLEPDSALEQVMGNCLDSGTDNIDTNTQARYWPPEGCSVYGKFEVRFQSWSSSLKPLESIALF